MRAEPPMEAVHSQRPDREDDQCLDPRWRRWVVDCLSAGATGEEVLRELTAAGVPPEIARGEIEILASVVPGLAFENAKYRQVMNLLGEQAPEYIARRDLCDAQEFYDRYFTGFRPVLFRDGCSRMAAMNWSFADLRERFGDTVVDVGVDSPRPMRIADAVDAMLAPDASPDLYIVSKGRALAGPLAELTAELTPLPPFLHPVHAPATANLWMGPGTTCTPLHHDTTHVYFCQLFGKKQYRLVAPWTVDILTAGIGGDGTSEIVPDPSAPYPVHTVELSPGESLFIPTGWWHEVRALEPSISVSMRAYLWPADFDWYRPGAALSPEQ